MTEKRRLPVREWPEYWAWTSMKQRCCNKNSQAYRHYGGRGIKVCERWQTGADGMTGLETFVHDLGPRPGDDYSLERIDNDGDYTPENCCWATSLDQSRNNRNCRLLTFKGKTQSVTEWAEDLGISRSTIYKRLDMGCSVQDALVSSRVRTTCRKLTKEEKRQVAALFVGGEYTHKALGERFGISPRAVRYYGQRYGNKKQES